MNIAICDDDGNCAKIVEIYAYSFELLMSTIINSAMVLILAIIFGRLKESLCFAVVFATLRPMCGGFHASSHFKCISTI